jgi:hypothetical protein
MIVMGAHWRNSLNALKYVLHKLARAGKSSRRVFGAKVSRFSDTVDAVCMATSSDGWRERERERERERDTGKWLE